MIKLKNIVENKSTKIFILILSPFLGFLAFFLPVLFKEGIEITGKRIDFLSIIKNTFENAVFFPTVVLLSIIGFLLGFAIPRFWFFVGFSIILVFPITAVYEMNISPSSHNLWPFEFFFYGLFCIPSIFGSFLGREWKKRGEERKQKNGQAD